MKKLNFRKDDNWGDDLEDLIASNTPINTQISTEINPPSPNSQEENRSNLGDLKASESVLHKKANQIAEKVVSEDVQDKEDDWGDNIEEVLFNDGIQYDVPEEENNLEVVNTHKIRVDFDKVKLPKLKLSLHRLMVNIDSPGIFNSVKKYTPQEIGIKPKEVKPKSAIVHKGADLIVINSNGDTLGDFLKRKRYNANRVSLLNLLKTAGDNNLAPTPYEVNREKENVQLEVLHSKARDSRFVRAKDEKAFLKKNTKKTAYQETILKNLGLTEKELNRLVSPKSILTEEEKARLLSVGSGIDNKIKGKRKKRSGILSFGDLDLLNFLDLCKMASLRNLYYATGCKSIGSLSYQLKRLEAKGVVRCVIVYNSPGVWSLTSIGRSLIGSERKPPKKNQAGLSSLAERIYVNHVQACLFSGCLDILQEGKIRNNRKNNYGNFVQGETIVPEMDITSALGNKLTQLKGGIFIKDSYKGESSKLLRESWEIAWRKWENDGRKVKESPELKEPWYYALFQQVGVSVSYIVPDIVVKRPRKQDGSPSSIAIEVERKDPVLDNFVRKLAIYKEDNRVYEKVIYVVSSSRIAKVIKEAAKLVNFTRYDIVPMINEDGIVKNNTSHWYL